MRNHVKWLNLDIPTIILTLVICAGGVLMVWSATRSFPLQDPILYVRQQLMWIGIGLVALAAVVSINYKSFFQWGWIVYAASVLLLFAVLYLGREAGGATRWLDLGFINLQPSEWAKIALIIILARLLAQRSNRLNKVCSLVPMFCCLLVALFLISIQPDLGTSLVLVFIFIAMLFMAAVPVKFLAGISAAGAVLVPLLYAGLFEYQRMRLVAFLNLEADPLGSGYQAKQALIAIGSGGVEGKGFFQGTQAQLQFIPEQHTDFIFSVLGEELGLIGALLLLLAYLLLIYRILHIGSVAADFFGALLCVGVAAMIAFQVIVNIGINVGLIPVTGLPLPLVSYGGNSMLVNLVSVGIVLNVGLRRKKALFT